jgi:hypothetical protein
VPCARDDPGGIRRGIGSHTPTGNHAGRRLGGSRAYPGQSDFAERVRRAWPEAGRVGTPLLHASVTYAFGDDATVGAGRGHLVRYYGLYPDYAKLNTADMITEPHDARDTVHAYRDLGFDRLISIPVSPRSNKLTDSPTRCCNPRHAVGNEVAGGT